MPLPAPVSTSTWWPARANSRTPAGTNPTRYSWILISFGTPIFILGLLRVGVAKDRGLVRQGRQAAQNRRTKRGRPANAPLWAGLMAEYCASLSSDRSEEHTSELQSL